MHPVSNEVDVSTEQVEKYLMECVRKRFTGQCKIHARVLEEAGQQVVFIPTGREIDKVGTKRSAIPPLDFGTGPIELEKIVQVKLAENKDRFRLGMRLHAVLANFVDGRLMGFEWETVG
jgi:hypothetical protein